MQITKENAAQFHARRRQRHQFRQYMKGRYIVTYKLDRKNAKKHICFRADKLQDCLDYIMLHKYTDRYYQIYDYNWERVDC